MKRIYLFVMVLVLAVYSYAAVTLPETCTASLPKKLLKNIINESEINSIEKSKSWDKLEKSGKFWTAYSDRENNTTYNSASISSGKYSELTFNENVRIAKIENGFALVYTEQQKGIDYPHISRNAISRGWVPMDNLLLWSSCPTNDVGIYNKALIVMNLDEVRKGSNQDLGKRYLNPETKTGGGKLRSSMNFYFVMKKSNNGLVLLAKECKMEGYTDNVLYGWVSTSSYVPWDQRTCIEPNWKPNDAEQMVGKNVEVYKDFITKSVGCQFPLGRTNTVTDTRSTKYRMNPQEMRYPLMTNDSGNDDFYKVTAFARPDGGAHVSIVPEDQESSAPTIVEGALKDASTINLIVVIDGTRSMENYYQPTQKIIQDAYNTFGKENGTIVKVGIVIYRDYTDGEYVTEHLSMTSPTDPKVAAFLTTGGKYGVKSSSSDRTYTEALYKGIEVALNTQLMGYSQKNSNLMFVIGDCGNDPEDSKCLSEDEIIQRCIANKIQLCSFQVRNMNEQAFLLFRQQMRNIVKGTTMQQYAKLGSSFKAGFKELSDGYEFKTTLPANQNFYMGSTRNAKLDQVMDVSKLYDIVQNSYMQFNNAILAQKGVIHNGSDIIDLIGDSESSKDGTGASIDLKFLETKFTAQQIAELKKNNNLMAFQGYTNKKTSTDINYWQPIIYISSDEFAGLMEKLQPVMTAANAGSSDRKPYVAALKALTRSMVPDITEKEMDEKDVKEVMALISGLNVTSESLKGRTLIQIQDENIVPVSEFDGMIAEFRNKFQKLKKIREQHYPFSIERNKTTWYWIPVEDLP